MSTEKRQSAAQALSSLTKKQFQVLSKNHRNETEVFARPKPTAPKPIEKPKLITKKMLWSNFLKFYRVNEGCDFVKNPESLANIAPVIKYFAKEPDFAQCANLVKRVGNSPLKPSLDKGLLIIGTYGNGKTSVMRALARMYDHYQLPMRFKTVNAHDMVTEFESIDNPGDKSLFYERYKCKSLHIDDVKKEQQASNYGKVELIRVILEKRYDAGLQTFITCNYREGDAQQDMGDALLEFGERYGEHIYDRLFKMFNIIQFTGKSFR